MQTMTRICLFLVSAFLGASTLKADPDMTYATDLLLTGTISKYPILLQVEGDGESKDGKGACRKVQGSYMYSSVMSPIALEGTICPEKGTFLLYHDEGGANEECFEGTLKEGVAQWEGKWKKGDKQLDLSLELAENMLGKGAVKRFMDYVKWDMVGEEEDLPMEDAVVDNAGVDADGNAFIEGFKPGWNGDVTFFSPTRLSYYTDYTSTARSTMFSYTLQALAGGEHFLELGTWMNYDKTEDMSDFGYQVSIWTMKNGEYEPAQVLPEGVEAYASGEASSYEDGEMDAEVGPDRLKLRLGEETVLLKWKDGKFVR